MWCASKLTITDTEQPRLRCTFGRAPVKLFGGIINLLGPLHPPPPPPPSAPATSRFRPRRFYSKTLAQLFGVSYFSVTTILTSFTNGRHLSFRRKVNDFCCCCCCCFSQIWSIVAGFICNPKMHALHDLAVIYDVFTEFSRVYCFFFE